MKAKINEIWQGGVRFVRQNGKWVAAGGLVLGCSSLAHATDATISDAQTVITGAAVGIAAVAGAIAAPFAAIWVYRKTKKGANQASS